MSDRPLIRVRDVMKTNFDLVEGMDTVQMALERMIHVETKSLIVKKRHDDDEYGLVMLSDIARQVLAKDRAPERINIYEIMTKPALTVSLNMDIRYCARIFSRFDLSRAPVVDNRKIVGIVSYTDMVLKGLNLKSE
ncbi:MAG: CBS domain-containing protein [Candidatus Thiodiazotropha sp. (ex Lucinoma aequizonata)]|nr:CBS domain-containing protein [Candidatus Thiodiazotropha sp. (ex Lucinoma aequizonata)]MCU7888811.1 CBS domain-containing protein [Candidatus Thiodiazotropha sp. (ex Lucinoma aequizonata)]MCU7896522.1 CBS domain-containing protein [Candidatus Thiodiazotropha sp. (ex Lucinoma aequizonata)]MCU7899597.1 CBS domain-containing protein [Candidatus Thiodiazotropha sp. (ex Lucinoma aequizonata)]MCU7902169.1 CBS domain-containing protein [Candidatus Thiodiazotropha sp. (ex Lucinoma aequizonata)]